METCTVRETSEQAFGVSAQQSYTFDFNLSMYQRALDIADNFQEYRIKSVEFKYTPLYDTFMTNSGGTSGSSLPYLYNKVLTVPAPTVFGLPFMKTMGAKPQRLDDKTITLKYRPCVNQTGVNTQANSNAGTRGIKSPWISTHLPGGIVMDDTLHIGHATWIDTYNYGVNNPVIATIESVVIFEFRKPWDAKASSINGVEAIKYNPRPAQ